MKILVAKMKHEDVYIDFTNANEAYLKLFNLYDENEYYCLNEEDIKDQEKEAQERQVEIEQLKAVNTKTVNEAREKLEKKLRGLQREIGVPTQGLQLYNKAKAGDGAAAAKLLNLRKDHEYEGWNIEDVR